MRRRSKRGPNDSESTGKIGQELPSNQLAPLRPAYPEPAGAATSLPEPAPPPPRERPPAAEKQQSPATSLDASAPAKSDQARGRGRRRRGGSGRGRGGRAGAPALAPGESASPEHPGTGHEAPHGDPLLDPLHDPEDEPDEDLEDEPGPDIIPVPPSERKLVMETQPDSPSIPPPAAQAAPQGTGLRQPRGFVVLTIGLPGSGKTTWFKRRSVTPLSSDMLRGILFDDITEQRYQGLVFSTLRSLLRARLIAKMPWNYVDATNLSPHERRQWIKMAASFGYDVHAVFFDVPFDLCMERNRRRERVVSDEVMEKMNERLRPPSFKEGFSKITVVRVKGVPGSVPAGDSMAEPAPEPVAESASEPANDTTAADASEFVPEDNGTAEEGDF